MLQQFFLFHSFWLAKAMTSSLEHNGLQSNGRAEPPRRKSIGCSGGGGGGTTLGREAPRRLSLLFAASVARRESRLELSIFDVSSARNSNPLTLLLLLLSRPRSSSWAPAACCQFPTVGRRPPRCLHLARRPAARSLVRSLVRSFVRLSARQSGGHLWHVTAHCGEQVAPQMREGRDVRAATLSAARSIRCAHLSVTYAAGRPQRGSGGGGAPETVSKAIKLRQVKAHHLFSLPLACLL